MIEVKNVYFKYNEDYVLKDVSFSISKGEKIALLGPNGSGKTSLLKILNGLIFPEKGKVLFHGFPFTKKNFKDKYFRKEFRTSVGMMFQNVDIMLFNPTIYDELSFGLKQLKCEKINEKINFCAQKLNLLNLLGKSPVKLSGGEKKRVALASILILNPELLLLDEPFSSLDQKTTEWLIHFLNTLDSTLLVTCHHFELAKKITNRVIVLSENNEIIYDGDIHKFKELSDKLAFPNILTEIKNN